MIIVLTVLSTFSGGLLAALRNVTLGKNRQPALQFVKGPANHEILKSSSNDPIAKPF
jgi:electron transport complex protein RnfG